MNLQFKVFIKWGINTVKKVCGRFFCINALFLNPKNFQFWAQWKRHPWWRYAPHTSISPCPALQNIINDVPKQGMSFRWWGYKEAASLDSDQARFYWRRIFLEWHKIQGIKKLKSFSVQTWYKKLLENQFISSHTKTFFRLSFVSILSKIQIFFLIPKNPSSYES